MKNTIIAITCIVLGFNLHSQRPGYVKSNGVTLFYREFGTGEPLLIINGGPGYSSEGFAALADSLSSNARVILYDQRGTGKSVLSKLDTSTITMDLMLQDIEDLRRHLNIQKWTVLGHSFGGMLACYYITAHPNTVKNVILSSSGGIDLGLLNYVSTSISSKLTAGQQDSLAYWSSRIEAGDTTYFARLKRAQNLAHAYIFQKKYLPTIANRLTQGNSKINGLIWQDLQRIHYNCSGRLRSFKGKALIIQGKQDIITEETAMKAKAEFSDARLVIMDSCVHYGWVDRPDIYFKEIRSFLKNTAPEDRSHY